MRVAILGYTYFEELMKDIEIIHTQGLEPFKKIIEKKIGKIEDKEILSYVKHLIQQELFR